MAVFTTGQRRCRFGSTPRAAPGPSADRTRPLPGVRLSRAAPVPDRVEADRRRLLRRRRPGRERTRDGHRSTDMRPVFSDYGLFGAAVRVDWIRMGAYATTRHVHLAGARQRPRRERLADAHVAALPARPAPRSPSRRGRARTSEPDASWSAWQPCSRRSDREPDCALHPVPREHDQLGICNSDARARADHVRSWDRPPRRSRAPWPSPPAPEDEPDASQPRRAVSRMRTATR